MSGTARDVWAQMGLGPQGSGRAESVEAPAAAQARSPAQAPRVPRGRDPLPTNNYARSVDRLETTPVASNQRKERVARPSRLQINITARAERLIRAGVEAKRAEGLRGHDASITVVVEEALEAALGRLAPSNGAVD